MAVMLLVKVVVVVVEVEALLDELVVELPVLVDPVPSVGVPELLEPPKPPIDCLVWWAMSREAIDSKLSTDAGLMVRPVTLARKMYRLALLVTPVRPTISIQMMLAAVSMNGRATQKNLPTLPMMNLDCVVVLL